MAVVPMTIRLQNRDGSVSEVRGFADHNGPYLGRDAMGMLHSADISVAAAVGVAHIVNPHMPPLGISQGMSVMEALALKADTQSESALAMLAKLHEWSSISGSRVKVIYSPYDKRWGIHAEIPGRDDWEFQGMPEQPLASTLAYCKRACEGKS